ncbi:MAG: hypothetical protein GYB67_13175, partial [Chloroflexi bacterium]|nr:hypothetical protein [Chloroflexota bacterium]
FPIMEEIARVVYNHFNPTAILPAVRDATVPATCELLGNPVIEDLLSLDVNR